MKTKEETKTDTATAQAVAKAGPKKVRARKQRDASSDGTKGERATAESAKGAPKVTKTGTKVKKSAKKAGKAEVPAAQAKGNRQPTKRISGLTAAAKILAESKQPMTCRAIVEAAFEKGYWKSGGKTPHATIYSAMIREIATKGEKSRFQRVGRGTFAVSD